MSVPLATTTITVRRPPASPSVDHGTDLPPPPEVVVSGVRAHIGSSGGTETPPTGEGEQSTTAYPLHADPCDLTHRDLVTDDATGITYRVLWAVHRRGLQLDHVAAGLQLVEGVP